MSRMTWCSVVLACALGAQACGKGDPCDGSEPCCTSGLMCLQTTSEDTWQCHEDCDPTWLCNLAGGDGDVPPTRAPLTPRPAFACALTYNEGEYCMPFPNCCAQGLACYEQHPYYAECRPACDAADPTTAAWSCAMLSTAAAASPLCTETLVHYAECTDAPTCCTPGLKCYQKSAAYAQCRIGCNPADTYTSGWTCTDLAAVSCLELLADGDSCVENPHCCGGDLLCYEKQPGTAQCRATCDDDGWTCRVLAATTAAPATPAPATSPPPAPPACDRLLAPGESCIEAPGCCEEGLRCYKKNAYTAQCRVSCPRTGWSCEDATPSTPCPQAPATPAPTPVPTPAPPSCAVVLQDSENCRSAINCCGAGLSCYELNAWFTYCLPTGQCTPGFFWACKLLA